MKILAISAIILLVAGTSTVALNGLSNTAQSQSASTNDSRCDFWLQQAGDVKELAVKHSYCIRRQGF